MADAGRDDRLREAAANRGLRLVKSRRRKPGSGDYGRYGLADSSGRELFGFGKSGLTATAEEIEQYLQQGAVADWKTSLGAEGGKSARKPKRARAETRRDPEPEERREPEPEPPPLTVREAKPADSEAIAALVSALAFPASAEEVATRLARLKRAGETPLVAERGEVVGCLAWHVTPVLHRPHPVGRITMMIVAEGERRQGVGRALVEAAAERLRAKGCGLIEVTSNIDLSSAHTFYRKLGFERTSYRFALPLDRR